MSPKAPKVERIRARPTVIRRRRWKVVDSEEPSVIWKRRAKRNFEFLFWEAIDAIDEQRRKDAACFISKDAVRLITHIVLTMYLCMVIHRGHIVRITWFRISQPQIISRNFVYLSPPKHRQLTIPCDSTLTILSYSIHISPSHHTSRPLIHRISATYYSKLIKNMPSNYSRMLRDIIGNQKPGGVPQGRSTYAWSRIGEKDGEEGSKVEESDTPVIAAGVLTVVTVIVVGSWLWIRNVRG
ncbi:hypothetical protein HBI81_125510 [Parastagonospora nodorum]|nr:hypothetical protein HBI81_125510 [Parastagonospora nodorum]